MAGKLVFGWPGIMSQSGRKTCPCWPDPLSICTACVMVPASAEQLYSWTDENGVTHYSSLPPTNIETKKAYDTIDTTFTPSEREANKKFREQQKQNSADAAAAEESKKLWVQRCKDLANDKVRFSERRINDT